jgi:hypothetical protein
MADPSPTPSGGPPPHRGRVQAQGGDTEKSEAWAQATPPSISDVLAKLDDLENSLTPAEKRQREEAFKQAREYVRKVPKPGLEGGTKKSFPRRKTGSIRVDIEVITGLACVPDDTGE